MTNASTIGLILGAIPIFAALFGLALGRERLSGRFWLGAGVSFVGVGLVAVGVRNGEVAGGYAGILLGLGICATWAAYSVAVAPLMTVYSPSRVSAVVIPVTWVLLALTSIPRAGEQDWHVGWEIWMLLVFATVGPLVLTNVLWFRVDLEDRPSPRDARREPAAVRRRFARGRSALRATGSPPGARRSAHRVGNPSRPSPNGPGPGDLESGHEPTRLHADRRLGPPRDLGREREAGGVLLRERLRLHAHRLRRPRDGRPRPRLLRARAGRHPLRADERAPRRQRHLQVGGDQGRQRARRRARRSGCDERLSPGRSARSSRRRRAALGRGRLGPRRARRDRDLRRQHPHLRQPLGVLGPVPAGVRLGLAERRAGARSRPDLDRPRRRQRRARPHGRVGRLLRARPRASRSSRTSRTRTSRPSTPRSCRRS